MFVSTCAFLPFVRCFKGDNQKWAENLANKNTCTLFQQQCVQVCITARAKL